MLFLVLGRGKTGSLVAEVAHERGHGVRVLGEEENHNASALTAPFWRASMRSSTSPLLKPSCHNLRACLANGARVVVGTTGWYEHLERHARSGRAQGCRTCSTAQISRLACRPCYAWRGNWRWPLPHYSFSITETHHADKKDAPSGNGALDQAGPRSGESVPQG